MRRILLIVFLVILGAAVGGGIGVGVAVYFLQNRTSQTESSREDTTVNAAVPEAAELAKKLALEEGAEGASKEKDRSRNETKPKTKGQGKSKALGAESPAEDTVPTLNVAQMDTTKPSQPNGQNLNPKPSKTGGTDITVPTIDLSSTIDLNAPTTRTSTPRVPTVQPDLKKSTPTFTLNTLSEEEIKKVYYTEGNLTKAERMLRKELKRNPRNGLAKKYLRLIKMERQALALEAQGDSEGAKRIWRQILRIAPDHPRAKKHLK